MKLYLAAPWAQKDTAREIARYLEAQDFTIVSRWLREHKNSNLHEELQVEAVNDLADIEACEALVLLNLEKSEGKATELGYAYKCQIPCIVVGSSTGNVFYHLPGVRVVDTIEQAIATLNTL